MRGDGEDFQDQVRQDAHDAAVEAQQVADAAEEASPAHAVAVALDAFRDACDALTRARACLLYTSPSPRD